MTSDEMFAQMDENKKYDLIFIDGMHTSEYCDRDMTNSFKHLNKDGIICVHDTIPRSKEANLSYDEYHNPTEEVLDKIEEYKDRKSRN